MNLKELLQKRLIEKIESDKKLASELMIAAEKDIAASTDILKAGHADWAFVAAYNAMLSAGRALMAVQGYRAYGESHHIAVVQFCSAIMPAQSAPLIGAFNRYRVRRHDVVYGEIKSVSDGEAGSAAANAKGFIAEIKKLCKL